MTGLVAMCGTALVIAFKQAIVNGFWWLVRCITTTVEITSGHSVFHTLMTYLERETSLKLRVVRFMNGPWGNFPYTTASIGSGVHFVKIAGRPVIVTIYETSNGSLWNENKLKLKIIALGRHPDFVSELKNALDETSKKISYRSDEKMKVYTYKGDEKYGEWADTLTIHKRSLDTVYLPVDQKRHVIEAIREFHGKSQFHYEKGLPHHLGIAFVGPPGTGKTSFIQALVSSFDVHVCYLHSSELKYIQNASTLLPNNAWLVIEDIDSNDVTHQRTGKKPEKKEINIDKQTLKLKETEFTLDQALNVFDGMLATEGRVIVITSNHPEKLDSALMRPGRIDVVVNMGYVTDDVVDQFCRSFYDEPWQDVVRDTVTVSNLQQAAVVDKIPYQEFRSRFRK